MSAQMAGVPVFWECRVYASRELADLMGVLLEDYDRKHAPELHATDPPGTLLFLL